MAVAPPRGLWPGSARSAWSPREAIPPAVCAAPVTLTPDGLFPFTPDDVARSTNQGPRCVEVVVPARDLARVFPRTPGTAPDLLEAALDRNPELGGPDALTASASRRRNTRPRWRDCPLRPSSRGLPVGGARRDNVHG